MNGMRALKRERNARDNLDLKSNIISMFNYSKDNMFDFTLIYFFFYLLFSSLAPETDQLGEIFHLIK